MHWSKCGIPPVGHRTNAFRHLDRVDVERDTGTAGPRNRDRVDVSRCDRPRDRVGGAESSPSPSRPEPAESSRPSTETSSRASSRPTDPHESAPSGRPLNVGVAILVTHSGDGHHTARPAHPRIPCLAKPSTPHGSRAVARRLSRL